jgi:hypothetical protein
MRPGPRVTGHVPDAGNMACLVISGSIVGVGVRQRLDGIRGRFQPFRVLARRNLIDPFDFAEECFWIRCVADQPLIAGPRRDFRRADPLREFFGHPIGHCAAVQPVPDGARRDIEPPRNRALPADRRPQDCDGGGSFAPARPPAALIGPGEARADERAGNIFAVRIHIGERAAIPICAIAANRDPRAKQHALQLRPCRYCASLLSRAAGTGADFRRVQSDDSDAFTANSDRVTVMHVDRLRDLLCRWPGDFLERQDIAVSVPGEATNDQRHNNRRSMPETRR